MALTSIASLSLCIVAYHTYGLHIHIDRYILRYTDVDVTTPRVREGQLTYGVIED